MGPLKLAPNQRSQSHNRHVLEAQSSTFEDASFSAVNTGFDVIEEQQDVERLDSMNQSADQRPLMQFGRPKFLRLTLNTRDWSQIKHNAQLTAKASNEPREKEDIKARTHLAPFFSRSQINRRRQHAVHIYKSRVVRGLAGASVDLSAKNRMRLT